MQIVVEQRIDKRIDYMSGQGTFGKSPKVRNNRVIWTVNYIDYINLQKKWFFKKMFKQIELVLANIVSISNV